MNQQQHGSHQHQQAQQPHPAHLNHQHNSAASGPLGQQQNHYGRLTGGPNSSANNDNLRDRNLSSALSGTTVAGPTPSNANTHAHNLTSASGADPNNMFGDENQRVLQWVAELLRGESRETALMELSKKREQVPELALVIWHSFGVMTSLLQEIISVYPLLNPSQLTAAASNRVCNALALLQCVASHNDTRQLFLNGMKAQPSCER
jgi:CCR4-NOT transcription complex subunit 9